MATEAQQPLKISLPCSANLAALNATDQAASPVSHAHQYIFVKRDAAGRVDVLAAATDIPVGVIQNTPKVLDAACELVVVGITKVQTTSAGTAFTSFQDLVAASVADTVPGTAQKATATGMGAAYVQGTKVAVGKIAPVGGAGTGLPSANDMTRISVNCLSPVPAT